MPRTQAELVAVRLVVWELVPPRLAALAGVAALRRRVDPEERVEPARPFSVGRPEAQGRWASAAPVPTLRTGVDRGAAVGAGTSAAGEGAVVPAHRCRLAAAVKFLVSREAEAEAAPPLDRPASRSRPEFSRVMGS